ALAGLRKLDQAASDLTRALQLDPDDFTFYRERGGIELEARHFARALADVNRAIEMSPRDARAFRVRGVIQSRRGRFEDAIADYKQALALDEDEFMACNDLAWLWATCPLERFRDGKRALEYATRACELTSYRNPASLDTLAAALAEC